MSTDLLIGGADNYTWEQLRGWVLTSRYFSGSRILLTYRMTEEVENLCTKHGIRLIQVLTDIYGRELNHNARDSAGAPGTMSHEMRFYHAWQLLEQMTEEIRYVVFTDTRDVIFQSDPIEFLKTSLDNETYHEQFLAPQEGITFEHEPWGANNMYRAFGGYVFEKMRTKPTYNCGTIAGRMPYFKEVLLANYFMACGRPYPADQCSLAILIDGMMGDKVYKCPHDEGWACQCGVTADPEKMGDFREWLITAEPTMNKNGEICTSTGGVFCMVHQYDRNPDIARVIKKNLDEYEQNFNNHPVS